jgi:hypothetical protein
MALRILSFTLLFFSYISFAFAQREPYSFLSVIQAGLPNHASYPDIVMQRLPGPNIHQRDLRKFEGAIPLLQFYSNRLIAAGLPAGYAVIPIVESNNSPKALSRVGALGVWQLMPDTARKYGLIVDFYEDERYFISQSTSAAVSHLAYLSRLFDNPIYVLAAYNWGERHVLNFIKQNPKVDPNSFLNSPKLPEETRSYVIKIYELWRSLSILSSDHPLHIYPNVSYLSFDMSPNFVASKGASVQFFLDPIDTFNRERLAPTQYFYSYFQAKIDSRVAGRQKVVNNCSNESVSSYKLYVVLSGDSHERIINKFNVVDSSKKKFISEMKLHPGLVIKVPVSESLSSYYKVAC